MSVRVNTDTGYRRVTSGGQQVERFKMTVDPGSMGHIMGMLTSLYSDTALAVIREYSTNALDSHVASGNPEPIHITLPSVFKPSFVVQDFGQGLSVDDLEQVYCRYGVSTKRDNDDEVGMMGVGCKSALAYTTEFTVVAIKQGVRTVALVTRDADGAGIIEVRDTRATNERNGVTITVAVDDVESFRTKAERFFLWWEPGTVLVNGREPERPTEALVVDDTISVFQGRAMLSQDIIIMGGVAYPAEKRLSGNLPYNHYVVARVPIGAVAPSPSRESMIMNPLTLRTLADVRDRMEAGIATAAERDIVKATTPAEAIRLSDTWMRLMGKVTPQFRGKDIPTMFTKPAGLHLWDTHANRYAVESSLGRVAAIYTVDALHVTGFTAQTLAPYNRARLRWYLEQQGLNYRRILVGDTLLDDFWMDGAAQVDWEVIKALKMPRQGGGPRNSKAVKEFDIWVNGVGSQVTDVLGDDIIIRSPSEGKDYNTTALSKMFKDSVVLELGKNRWGKFEREHEGKVRHIGPALAKLAEDFAAGLTDAEYRAAAGHAVSVPLPSTIAGCADSIHDPELAEAVRAMSNNGAAEAARMWRSIRQVSWAFGVYPELPERRTTVKDYTKVANRYSLLRGHHYSTKPSDIIEYVNAVYAFRKAN
jgi:hypothetical protein